MRDGKVSLLARIVTVLVYLFLMAPLAVIILASFSPTPIVTFPPKGFSTEWYAKIFDSSTNFVSGFVNSMQVAVIATAIDIVLGVTAAHDLSRYRYKVREALDTIFTSPKNEHTNTYEFLMLNITRAIGGIPSFVKILLGHVVIILPYIVRNTLAVLAAFNWTLEDAAAGLGANAWQTFRHVTFPLIKPGVTAGALLSFLYSFDEVVLSGLLSSAKFMTLPIRIMNYMEFSFDPTLAAVSTLLILFSFIAIVLLERFMGLDMFVKQD